MSLKVSVIPVTAYQQNCSILYCENTGKAALIDPGGEVDILLEYIASINARLEKIFLTHGHIDHVGAASEISARAGVPIIGPHIADKFWLDDLPQYAQMMGFPPSPALTPDQWLEDGDKIQFGEIVLDVIHCPGHTPGHVVFYHPESALAFVGDVLFQGSVGRTDFPGGDHDQLVESITKKLWPLGDAVEFIPGHGPMSSFGEERKYNPFVADTQFG